MILSRLSSPFLPNFHSIMCAIIVCTGMNIRLTHKNRVRVTTLNHGILFQDPEESNCPY